jgi:hypothetical protein
LALVSACEDSEKPRHNKYHAAIKVKRVQNEQYRAEIVICQSPRSRVCAHIARSSGVSVQFQRRCIRRIRKSIGVQYASGVSVVGPELGA